MTAIQPIATIGVAAGHAYVISHTSQLPKGTHVCYSVDTVNALLREIATLKAKLETKR